MEKMTAKLAPMLIPDEMDREIIAYWHARLLPSKAAAVRELLACALDRKLARESDR